MRDTTGWNTGALCLVFVFLLFKLNHLEYLSLLTALRANALHILTLLQGVPKKMHPRFVWMISPATNRIDGWAIFHLKGGIHSSVGCTKIFLYDIRKPRNKKIEMGYQN